MYMAHCAVIFAIAKLSCYFRSSDRSSEQTQAALARGPWPNVHAPGQCPCLLARITVTDGMAKVALYKHFFLFHLYFQFFTSKKIRLGAPPEILFKC